MDKLRAMQTFVRIVQAGSLTAAAQARDTSLTSVVRSLSALERTLGVRLLNRTTRRIALTDEGRDYFERCQRVLAEVEEAEAALSARRIAPAGRLAITAPVMFGRLHVAPVVTAFLTAHSEVRVELLLLDRVVDLLEEGLDLAVRIGHLRDSSLVALPLGSTHRMTCASPRYLRRHGMPRVPADLARHRCIRFTGLTPGAEWGYELEGRSVAVPVSGVFATNQIDAALDACIEGLGCGVFLGYQVADALAAGKLKRILRDYEPAPVPVSLVYPHTKLMSSRVRAFIDWTSPRLRARLAP